jgi:hypothetical protein
LFAADHAGATHHSIAVVWRGLKSGMSGSFEKTYISEIEWPVVAAHTHQQRHQKLEASRF